MTPETPLTAKTRSRLNLMMSQREIRLRSLGQTASNHAYNYLRGDENAGLEARKIIAVVTEVEHQYEELKAWLAEINAE